MPEKKEEKTLFYYEPKALDNPCLLINYSIYYPWELPSSFSMGIKVNGQLLEDVVLDRRLLNTDFLTLNKLRGKNKANPFGYPLLLSKKAPSEKITLSFVISNSNGAVEYVLPVVAWLDANKPLAKLNVSLMESQYEEYFWDFIVSSIGKVELLKGIEEIKEDVYKYWAIEKNSYIEAAIDRFDDQCQFNEIKFKETRDKDITILTCEDVIYPVPVGLEYGLYW